MKLITTAAAATVGSGAAFALTFGLITGLSTAAAKPPKTASPAHTKTVASSCTAASDPVFITHRQQPHFRFQAKSATGHGDVRGTLRIRFVEGGDVIETASLAYRGLQPAEYHFAPLSRGHYLVNITLTTQRHSTVKDCTTQAEFVVDGS